MQNAKCKMQILTSERAVALLRYVGHRLHFDLCILNYAYSVRNDT
jgi:hypothetical protein